MNELGVFDYISDINPRSPSAAFGEPVSFVAMADVSEQGRLNSVEVRNAVSGYTPFAEGDVLVAKITPCLENGKGAHARHLPVPLGQGSTEFHVLRARPGTSDRYLYHLTRTDRFRLQAEALMTGSAGQRRVPKEFFRRYQIRVPALEEQRRIAEILDTIDETIQATERVIAKRRVLRAGLAADLLKPPNVVASSEKSNGTMRSPALTSTSRSSAMRDWTWDELGRLAELRMGQSPPGSVVGELRDGLPFLQGNAEFGSRSPRPRYQCIEAPRRAEPGDVLISVRAPVGAINIADQAYGIGRGLAAVRFLKLDQRFGHHALQETAIMLNRLSQGTTFAAIGRTELASLRLPAPRLEEQRRIAEILDAVDGAIQLYEAELVKLGELRAGLAGDLLSGCVRTVAA